MGRHYTLGPVFSSRKAILNVEFQLSMSSCTKEYEKHFMPPMVSVPAYSCRSLSYFWASTFFATSLATEPIRVVSSYLAFSSLWFQLTMGSDMTQWCQYMSGLSTDPWEGQWPELATAQTGLERSDQVKRGRHTKEHPDCCLKTQVYGNTQ